MVAPPPPPQQGSFFPRHINILLFRHINILLLSHPNAGCPVPTVTEANPQKPNNPTNDYSKQRHYGTTHDAEQYEHDECDRYTTSSVHECVEILMPVMSMRMAHMRMRETMPHTYRWRRWDFTWNGWTRAAVAAWSWPTLRLVERVFHVVQFGLEYGFPSAEQRGQALAFFSVCAIR